MPTVTATCYHGAPLEKFLLANPQDEKSAVEATCHTMH